MKKKPKFKKNWYKFQAKDRDGRVIWKHKTTDQESGILAFIHKFEGLGDATERFGIRIDRRTKKVKKLLSSR